MNMKKIVTALCITATLTTATTAHAQQPTPPLTPTAAPTAAPAHGTVGSSTGSSTTDTTEDGKWTVKKEDIMGGDAGGKIARKPAPGENYSTQVFPGEKNVTNSGLQPDTTVIVNQGDYFQTGNFGSCTIGYVTPTYALTASHCVSGAKNGEGMPIYDAFSNFIGYGYQPEVYKEREKRGPGPGYMNTEMNSVDTAIILFAPNVHGGENIYSGDTVFTGNPTRDTEGVACTFGSTKNLISCGPITYMRDDVMHFDAVIAHGDSGGPVWIPGRGFVGYVSSSHDLQNLSGEGELRMENNMRIRSISTAPYKDSLHTELTAHETPAPQKGALFERLFHIFADSIHTGAMSEGGAQFFAGILTVMYSPIILIVQAIVSLLDGVMDGNDLWQGFRASYRHDQLYKE